MNLLSIVLWTSVALTLLSLFVLTTTIILRVFTDRRLAQDADFRKKVRPELRAFLLGKTSMEAVMAVLRKEPHGGLRLLMEESESLGSGGREKLEPLLKALPYGKEELIQLHSRHWEKRLRGAEALGYIGDEDAVPALMKALQDDVLLVRFAAAESLARLGCQDAVEPILHSLDVAGDVSQRRVAEIIMMLDARSTEPILSILQSPSVSENSLGIAARVSGLLKIHRACPALRNLLLHQSKNVRLSAARSLGSVATHGDMEVIEAISSLGDDASWEVRCNVMSALGKLRATKEIPLLLKGLSDPQWWVRHNAAEALHQLGEPGITALRESEAGHADAYGRDISRQILQQHGVLQKTMEAHS